MEQDQRPNCYVPVKGGWRIRVTPHEGLPAETGSEIGWANGDPRRHRRPLYPPADKALLWREDQRASLVRSGFRPLVIAYNEPRFLLDLHSAGGLAGHLHVGLVHGDEGKWFHQFSDLEVSCSSGCMTYNLTDPSFPGVRVEIKALPLSNAAGAVLRVRVDGRLPGGDLVWAYGGASAFYTNYELDSPRFTFTPEDCDKDTITLDGAGFLLRRAFDEDDACLGAYMSEVYSAARRLPDWTVEIRGGANGKGQSGFGSPEQFPISPLTLISSTAWGAEGNERSRYVAVQRMPLRARDSYIVVGAGFNMDLARKNPKAAWKSALDRSRSIAGRIVTRTPDPYLDAAMTMMAFATEGTWGDSSILHGGWTWRQAFLGWRGWYGSTCYGWEDRVRQSIRNHVTLGRIISGDDAGALSFQLEQDQPQIWYNMNEVFLDQVRQYFDYTNDIALMGEIYSVLEGIIAWENRRLSPGDGSLYENSLNTWVSDSHWYIRAECTQASAYMLRAHEFMADVAARLGRDPRPYTVQAARIRAAMQERLWQEDVGVFAEYRDTLGHRLIHPEPELATIYHAAEFGAANPAQVSRMLRWVDANLHAERTPGGGRFVWTSNWFPNRGRSYTHTTRELSSEENINLAIPYWMAGRPDDAYALLRGVMCGIFNGPTPGGLSCHCDVNGYQRNNDEFADASSMWARAVCEGLFGILPRMPEAVIALRPQFPRDWSHAEIRTPHLAYRWRRTRRADGVERVCLTWEAPTDAVVRLRLPVPANAVKVLHVDGQPADYRIEAGFDGLNWVCTESTTRCCGSFNVEYTPVTLNPVAWPTLPAPGPPAAVWSPPGCGAAGARDLARWKLVDLSSLYNAALTEVPARIVEFAEPPAPPASTTGHKYWRVDHVGFLHHGSQLIPISDAAWRAKIDDNGVGWTTDGIPFAAERDGHNIAVVTLAGAGFPPAITFPVQAEGRALFLMLSGITFPMQSHVVNLRLTLRYADGEIRVVDLVNPFTIGDCWATWCGRFHDTATNGFENLGGRFGPAGSVEVADLTQPVAVDTEAHLVRLDLNAGVQLESFSLEAIANDIVFGVMGASILS